MSAADPMPIVPLGTSGAVSVLIRDHAGISRCAGAQDLATPEVLIALMGGSAWMRRNFPGQWVPVPQREGGYKLVPIGFDAHAVALFIVSRCIDAEVAVPPLRLPVGVPWFARFRDWFAFRFNLALASLS